MLTAKRTYKNKYVIGGAGIMDYIKHFFATIFSSNAAKQLASTALQARKTTATYIGMKAIHVGKTVAIDANKKLVEKAGKQFSTPKSHVANIMVSPEETTKTVKKL